MKLMVAISTHEGYFPYLDRAVSSALEVADYVKVYSDGVQAPVSGVDSETLQWSGYCVKARQKAIQDATEASVDYLLHLDGDDWLMRRPPMTGADMCFSDMYLCNDDGSIHQLWDCSQLPTEHDAAMEFLREFRTTPFSGKSVYRVDFLKEHGLSWYQWPNTTFAEDCRTIIEYLKHRPTVSYTPEQPYYVYRFHPGQDHKDEARRAEFLADLDDYLKGDG